MRKLRKTKKLRSDYLEELKRIFILPVLKRKPKFTDIDTFMRWAMHTNSRIISVYMPKAETVVPGVYLRHDQHAASPAHEPDNARVAKKYKRLVCRVDDREPDVIEIDNSGRVFRLTREHWQEFRKLLILAEGNIEL